jgi:hypothetical protein
MNPEVLGVLIPIVAIVGVMAVGVVKMWIKHREQLIRWQMERDERQSERDQRLLGLSSGADPNVMVILDRLTALERRMQALEGEPIPVPTPVPHAIPATTASPETHRERPQDVNLA